MNRSSLKVTLPMNLARGPSPTLETRHRLQVPGSHRSGDPKYMWGEEEVELIKTCALLSSSLGLYKSLSTSDIIVTDSEKRLRPWVSEENVDGLDDNMEEIFAGKFEPISRSCSTWVAVGDVVSSSQLPSPQGRHDSCSPAITAVDFIRSVNKKVRQSYIRKRLLMSYRVLKRNPQLFQDPLGSNQKGNAGVRLPPLPGSFCPPQEIFEILQKEVSLPNVMINHPAINPALSARDIERDKGRPLTRFERNMIIFNWLQCLEESPAE